MPNLDQLQKALENIEGKTPKEVLDAFIPEGKKIGGLPLVDITFGHALFLAQIEHPLAKGQLEGWGAEDIALALFCFTRSSRELKDEVRNDTLEDSLFDFIETIPVDEIRQSAFLLVAHYLSSLKTGVEMEDRKNRKAQKKTHSGGFLALLRAFAVSIIGRLITSFTKSRSVRP